MSDTAMKNLETVNNFLNIDMEDDRTQFNQLSEELLKRAAFVRSDLISILKRVFPTKRNITYYFSKSLYFLISQEKHCTTIAFKVCPVF